MPVYTTVFFVFALAVAFLAVQWNYFTPACAPSASACEHTGYLGYDRARKPHHSSWTSWWHPQRSETDQQSSRGQGAGELTKGWNILYHLGGNGPWVEKVVDVVEGGIAPPEGCEVGQVHMMSRHAERYPTRRAGHGMKSLVERMKKSGMKFPGDLMFFNKWDLFWSDDSQIEQLTTTGPFSGTLGAFTTGVRLRTRYQHLLARAFSLHPTITYWASDSPRVIDTARYFALGFFNHENVTSASNSTTLSIISESPTLGADTLTPGDTCHAYVEDAENGHDKGYGMMRAYRSTYLPSIRARLERQNEGMEWTDDEVYTMQEMCGFETTVRGRSDWCNVFTKEEFEAFEYARDLLHYYRAGPGTKYAGAMGWLWINATLDLMLEGADKAGSLFFSFVHDGDIAPMMTALDIINDEEHLPVTHIAHQRKWRKSQVSPMGGRVIFELLSCKVDASSNEQDKFVRVNINDGITAIPDCDSGPGRSCPLKDFQRRTERKGVEVGDFREVCGLGEDSAERITFLRQGARI